VTRRFRKIVSLILVGLVFLTTGSFAAAGVAPELEHDFAQTEPHAPAQGDSGSGCDQCCACHYTSHLFSTTSAGPVGVVTQSSHGAAPMPDALQLPRLSNSFFRPPRIS